MLSIDCHVKQLILQKGERCCFFLSTWVLQQPQTRKQLLLKAAEPTWSRSSQTAAQRRAAPRQVPACEQGKSCSAPFWLMEGKLMPAPSHRKRACLPGLGCVGWECNSTGTKTSSLLGLFQEDSPTHDSSE